ncbi:MAG: CHAT domain-containing tetratricopeptide repeat protein, partial [Fulvivirga sp.]|nr:CHAT domain-containing tetratricopeptide repeat protein [Fulvivirga sp.]
FQEEDNTTGELDAINQQGFLLSIQGDPQGAMELLQTALKRGLQIKDGKNPQAAMSYHVIGVAYYVAGMYKQAIEHTQKGYELRKELYDQPHEDIAKSLNNLGILYETIGELQKGLEAYEKAYELQKQLYGEQHIELANSLNNLGANAYYRGDYDQALEYYGQAIEMYESLVGKQHKEVADVYLNMGSVYADQLNFSKALEYTKVAESIYLKLYGKQHPTYLNLALNLSAIYKGLGQFKVALDYAREGYELAKYYYGEQHPIIGQLTNNMGILFEELGDLDQSIKWQKESLAINQATQGTNNLSVAYNYNNIATAYLKLNKLQEAEEFMLKSLKIKRQILGDKHPSVTIAWQNLSKIYFEQKEFQNALEASHNSLLSNHETFQDSSLTSIPPIDNFYFGDSYVQALMAKAGMMTFLYDNDNNMDWLISSTEHLKACRQLINNLQLTSSKEDKIYFSELAHDLANVALLAYVVKYQADPSYNDIVEMFEFIENSKGALLNAAIVESEAKNFAGIPDSLLRREDQLSKSINLLDHNLKLLVESGGDKETIIALRQELFTLKRTYEKLIKKFESEYPKYYELKHSASIVGIEKIQNEYLGNRPNTAIVEYLVMDSVVYALISTKDNLEIIQMKSAGYEKKIRGLRNAIIFKTEAPLLDLAHNLYKGLFKPVDDYLSNLNEDITELVIIPDGILGYLPFEVLLTEKTASNNFSQQHYLLQKYALKYALSSTILYKQSMASHSYGEKAYVAFAPVFSDGSETNFLVNTSERFYQPELDNTRNFVRDGKITPIPSTKDEVEQIHQMHEEKNLFARYFLFEDAKEENLKSPELGEFKFIHLATHGFINDEHPELSGLVMSQNSESEEDGILYVSEIYNLNWNANMVALSACETGLGKVVRGEGMLGLSRAFIYAGAANVLVSLWKVSDKSTSDLMIDFYNHVLENKPKAAALKEAKLKLISSKEFSNPYYWAPFILIGY